MSKWIKVTLMSRLDYMVEVEDDKENPEVEAQDIALDECPSSTAYEVHSFCDVVGAENIARELRHADGVCDIY